MTPRSEVPGRSGLLIAARVLSLSPGVRGDAIWWQSGRVREVGSAAVLNRQAPRTVPRFELPGAIVTPGFTDGHTHFAMWALSRRWVQLQGANTRAEAVRRVATGVPLQGWIRGQGWDANGWEAPPDRQLLDAVQPTPAFLESLDVHAAWVNSAGLDAAGITRATPDPFGGRIIRDAAGEPTGLLLERAVDLVRAILPGPPEDLTLSAVREAQVEAHRLGVTGIHDVEGSEALRAFRTLEAADELRLRVLFHPPVSHLQQLVSSGARSGAGSSWLGLGGVKLFLDGSLGSRTAWMLAPYERTNERGLPITSEAEARAAMQLAAGAGIACTVHAIGDAAVRRALDLFEPLPRAVIPHRIEHLQCVHPADLARAAGMGVVASMQPAHLLVDIPLVERHWGARGRGAYAFRSLLRAGSALVFGSDVPVASIDPREGVFAAMERRGFDGAPAAGWYPEERLSFEESLAAYTRGPAAAASVMARRGTLAPGQDADLVAWAMDPAVLRGAGEAVRAGRATMTVVGGEVVMRG